MGLAILGSQDEEDIRELERAYARGQLLHLYLSVDLGSIDLEIINSISEKTSDKLMRIQEDEGPPGCVIL